MAIAVAEEWRPILGYEDRYEVSDLGRVRSLYWTPPRIRSLTPCSGHSGEGFYLTVSLKCDGVEKRRYAHALVLEAFFVGPRLPDTQVRHRNGIKNDNRLSNLLWGTRKDNADDRIEHGTHPAGSRNGFARLTEADVPAIRAARAGGATVRSIAQQYGVNRETVGYLLRGKTWTHV